MKMPEPEIKEAKFGGYDAYTHEQMKQYGRDLLEAAAQKAFSWNTAMTDTLAKEIREIKETL